MRDRGFTSGESASSYKIFNDYNVCIDNSATTYTLHPNRPIKAGEIFGHTALDNNAYIIESSVINETSITPSGNFAENNEFSTSEIQLSFGLLSFGKGLTTDEATKYIQYIKELMSVV